MHKSLIIYLAATLFFSVSCAADDIVVNDLNPDELDIIETVFRYQFSNNRSAIQQNAKAYCLSIAGKDPNPEFIQRFTDAQPPVVELTSCPDLTQNRALIFRVDSIDWKKSGKADVGGGYYEGNVSASDEIYVVKKKKGKWQVIKAKVRRLY